MNGDDEAGPAVETAVLSLYNTGEWDSEDEEATDFIDASDLVDKVVDRPTEHHRPTEHRVGCGGGTWFLDRSTEHHPPLNIAWTTERYLTDSPSIPGVYDHDRQ